MDLPTTLSVTLFLFFNTHSIIGSQNVGLSLTQPQKLVQKVRVSPHLYTLCWSHFSLKHPTICSEFQFSSNYQCYHKQHCLSHLKLSNVNAYLIITPFFNLNSSTGHNYSRRSSNRFCFQLSQFHCCFFIFLHVSPHMSCSKCC